MSEERRSPPMSPEPKAEEKKEKRTSRACLVCRKRKSACHLPIVDGQTQTPCKRCAATGTECVIGSSNRGGRRVRKRTLSQTDFDGGSTTPSKGRRADLADPVASNDQRTHASQSRLTSELDRSFLRTSPSPAMVLDPALRTSGPSREVYSEENTRESSLGSGAVAFNDLQNPSDALGILAQIASRGHNDEYNSYRREPKEVYNQEDDFNNDYNYPLVKYGKLNWMTIAMLLQRYKRFYHPYFPLVPAALLNSGVVHITAQDSPHLLTAMLVIASRDLTNEAHMFDACAEHMRALVSALAAGGPGNVEAVEALLLLAEWAPYTSRSDAGHVGRGEEDREAWMHVGTALRIGYFLGLDRYSFQVRGDDTKDPQWQRKRQVWTACYISDRQISIRLGRAFWSRGPGPLTTLRKEDFPMLAAASPDEEDYASIFQATLELTLLFSNVHDVLYNNPGNSMRSHLSGGYIKYIDDFRSAIYGWKSVWGTLTCSPNLKATLLMSYDYLRLYTNAFAFHATVMRALPQTQQSAEGLPKSSRPAMQRIFYNNVGAVGDARFIYEGLDAAKSLLDMCNTFVDPEKVLRFMPLRFYLYCVYSAVFLYRARCAGVLAADEEQSVRQMVTETVSRLERSGIGTKHPGNRYAQLVKLLWDKVDRRERSQAGPAATLANPYRPVSVNGPAGAEMPDPMLTEESPIAAEVMGDFSWTDLDAIGNFAVNGGTGVNPGEVEWWNGFLPADSNNLLFDGGLGVDGWNMGMS